MENTSYRAVAIVGTGAILPDASNVPAFWENVKNGRYSVTDVDPERWDPALYYDPDPTAPDKTYSKIGGWVREYGWDPAKWHLPIPPRVVDAMDVAQKWAIASTREALEDYGYPNRPLNPNRTAVILGNAMAGERHYLTALRIYFPEYARELSEVSSFAALPASLRGDITRELRSRIAKSLPEITEDSMPGELANCIAGRIANIFNFHGPNYVCDAACASALAAISSAVEGLVEKDFDAVITGGIDRNMGASTFVKFCKIGALSATGSRPYAEGADGFVMGEGTAIFLLKRLADAERDGDKIYAVLRGLGGSSDGKGKGITAPNPIGQKLAVERAWQNAGLSPATATYIEGHGTSTRVGDVVEVQSTLDVLRDSSLPAHSIALGSVKSNFGHLKGAAGAAGLLKIALALRDKVIPPSVHCEHPNPEIDFAHAPLYVNTELRPWTVPADSVRRGGLSAFGFGGTNFHAVLEEYVPHRLNGNGKRLVAFGEVPPNMRESIGSAKASSPLAPTSLKAPFRGALVIGADSESALEERLRAVEQDARAGRAPDPAAPNKADLHAPERLAIDYGNARELAEKTANALKALAARQPAVWKALRAQGIFRGHGPAPKVAFLYPGQGSQYVNMLKPLLITEPIVAETFAEADRVMTPLLGKPLTEFIFVDHDNPDAVAKAEEDLRQTAITQPAVLAVDLALTRLLAAYGIQPDFAMGHSLGEYAALVASGALPLADALEAVSARGREMTRFSPEDKGRMTAVFAPLEKIEEILKTIDGYVVIANINSKHQSVIGGASKAVEQAMKALQNAGYEVAALPVSHAFHTSIVASASTPLRRVLERLHFQPPQLPIVANIDGEFYPAGKDVVPKMLDILAQQVASPVQFIKGLRTLYGAGARFFLEVGPKKALQGFAEDVLGDSGDAISIFTNHPKVGDVLAFNQALCCLYAAGLGQGMEKLASAPASLAAVSTRLESPKPIGEVASPSDVSATPARLLAADHYVELGRLLADVLDRAWQITGRDQPATTTLPVAISGAALGLPGTEHIFDDGNIARLLRGDQLIDSLPSRVRRAMLDKHITRLVKNDEGGSFETISSVAEVIKLAGRGGAFDLEKEFGISADRRAALDRVTQLAIAVGLDALRDAGIPLVMRYKTTSKGTQLPDRWALPDALRDDTGVVFASAFPGLNSFAHEMSQYYTDHTRREQLAMLQSLRVRLAESNGHSILGQEIDRRIEELCDVIEKEPYVFDRRYLFRVLSMGHSQFAEYIGARGPNTQINSACASTTQALALSEDWIRTGRCRRVIVVSADDITTDDLIDWMGAGFLATGAAATDEVVEEAATPFDRRRHGMIIGMGAAGLVVESQEAVRERGIQPICEVLSAVTANSAFHGTRLDVEHISQVMESLVARAESRSGIQRREIAPHTVFVSHETYTPARGGSAAAEIHALRQTFGDAADQIVIANTKGFTGHAMGAGVEDVLAVKALETGVVPPVANYKEVDPELGRLNLSKGGLYPIEYALRLGAGFGSQISMTLLHWVATKSGLRRSPNALGYEYRIIDPRTWNSWLSRVTGQRTADLEVVHHTLRVRDSASTKSVVEVAPESQAIPAESALLTTTSETPDVVPKPLSVSPKLSEPRLNVQAATPAPPERTLPATENDSVKERILALVVEKTGYPRDMLDLDLDLEADLGVDTVKQAEMFAAIREIYNIPRDENRKLRDYPTLARVIQFVLERRPDLATPAISAGPAIQQGENKPVPPIPVSLTEETADDPVKERILDLVVEKTGYPRDMLDLDLDLEADLGIDTVKQAEMFAAIRATYNIARDENLKLRNFPTLAHVIQFAKERSGMGGPARVPSTQPPQGPLQKAPTGLPATPGPRKEREQRQPLASLAAANSIPRRVPVPVLRPPLNMCKPTSVALDRERRVLVVADAGGVGDALARLLEKRGVEVLCINVTQDPDLPTNRLKSWLAAGPVHGIYWLPALDNESPINEMDLARWREALRLRVKSLYSTMRLLYKQIEAPGTFLMCATRLGGQHGYDATGALAPLGGAVAGFTKTYKRERTNALVKTVDFGPESMPSEVAELLIEETLRDPGAIEIGYKAGLRWTVGLEEQPAADGHSGLTLDKNTVFVVTGAAGSIVSAITADLAAASGGTFYLLDLVPEPDPNDPDLKRFLNEKEGLKRDLFARIQSRGERATPALVEKDLAALERAQAAQMAIDAVRAAGGTAHYFSVNLTDADAIAKVIAKVKEQQGRIDVLLHAAGVERSHFLPDKDPLEFDLVFDVKSDGFFNLLHAIGDMPLGTCVVFSSIAGRFGNPGQTDYSAANDLLCKIASSFRNTRPKTRGIAIDWTAWSGIGMASRGSIPKVMEAAGIEMLSPAAGVPVIRRELTLGGTQGEIVIAQSLGALLNEWDDSGGLLPSLMGASGEKISAAQGPLLGKISSIGIFHPLIVETTLDPKIQPFLYDHQIDGIPVLPGVMGIEAFAEAAQCLLPGWNIEAIENVDFLAPFKFYRNEPRTLTVEATIHPRGDSLVADCRLVGHRALSGQTEPQTTTHFTGCVRMTKRLSEAQRTLAPGPPVGATAEAASIYGLYFHGPAYQVVERVWWDGTRIVALMSNALPSNHHPAELPTIMAPRLLELCFQAAGILEMSVQDRMGLPSHVDSLSLLRKPDPTEGRLYAIVTPDPARESFHAEVVDASGNLYLQLDGYRTAALPEAIDPERLSVFKALTTFKSAVAA
jgi:acyl transferase domain-containing protein/NAD(P)-dependent dehydrogenase (short-subunit alcohol dehydrogenase family)